jgi:radical SAM superfamily enzyme YgiQ (UPF0313 family)
MNIALFTVNAYYACDGVRLISSLLKQACHRVRCVSLPRYSPLEYEADEIGRLQEILKDSELVMIAVYSTFSFRAVQITNYVRKNFPDVKVIWGGPHCIAAPENSLRHADGVCFGEGDQCIVQCVNKMASGDETFLKTPNMAFRIDGSVSVNDVLPPFSDLDSLPFYDYDLKDQYILDGDLFPLTPELLMHYFPPYPFDRPTLASLTSRGCPHQCAYCNNCRYISMFGRNIIRRQSVRRFMDELESILGRLHFLEHVLFGDDDFMIRPIRDLEEFAQRYRKNVGLPFSICVSATTFRKEKLEVLLDSGIRIIQLGVQSASQRVLDEVFNRKISVRKTSEVVGHIAPYHATHNITLLVDFIIDNPYESRKDIVQTYRYLIGLPEHTLIQIFRLVFFPGTPLYARALRDGFIDPYDERSIRRFEGGEIRFQNNYPTFLIFLFYVLHQRRLRRFVPCWILGGLASRPLLMLMRFAPKPFLVFLVRKAPWKIARLIILAEKVFRTIFPKNSKAESPSLDMP